MLRLFCRFWSLNLFSIGPVFTLEVPTSYFIFPIFGFHTLNHIIDTHHLGKEFYTGQHSILGIGIFMYVLSTLVLFPIYTCITLSILRKKVQKMFLRISIGGCLCLLGVASLLIIDTIGHSLKNINAFSMYVSMHRRQLHIINGGPQRCTWWWAYHLLKNFWRFACPAIDSSAFWTVSINYLYALLLWYPCLIQYLYAQILILVHSKQCFRTHWVICTLESYDIYV